MVCCAAATVTLAGCKDKKKTTVQTPSMAAKECAQCLKDGNYEGFVEAVVFEEPIAVVAAKPMNGKSTSPRKATPARKVSKQQVRQHAAALKAMHQPEVQKKGGIKDVDVVSETVSPDGQTAVVVVTNAYNNGDVDQVGYLMVNDPETQQWKVKVNKNKEVWRAVSNDGTSEVVKVRDGDVRDFVKVKQDGHKDFIKEIDGNHREVLKAMEDGHKEVIVDKGNAEREVLKVMDGGKEVGAAKVKATENKAVVKNIEDGDKEFVKVKEKRGGDVEVIKTLKDGERNKEVIKDVENPTRDVVKVKADGDKAVAKVKEEGNKEISKVKENVDGEVTKVKEVTQK